MALSDEEDKEFRKWWRWQIGLTDDDQTRAIAAVAYAAGAARAEAKAEIDAYERKRSNDRDWRILEDNNDYLTKKVERLERQLAKYESATVG